MANGAQTPSTVGFLPLDDPRRVLGGEIIGSLRLGEVLRPKARRKVQSQLKQRLAEERGVKPSEIPDEDVSRAGLDVLSEIGVRTGQFTGPFRRELRKNDLVTGQTISEPSLIRESFGLESPEEAGGLVTDPVTLRGGEPEAIDLTTPAGTLTNLEQSVLNVITQGAALQAGDFSSPLGQDVALGFNQAFGSGLGFGLASSGEANVGRIIGTRMAGLEVGGELISSGLGQLGVVDPLAFPGAQQEVIQNLRNQAFQNLLFQTSIRRARAASRALQPSLGERFEAATPALVGSAIGAGGFVGGAAATGFLQRGG